MKNKTKKIIISILFIVFILMIVHVPKVYGATITLDGITYDINGNQATVINGSGVSGDITIDSTIRTVNAEVVRIGASAFANNNRITSITVIGNGSTPIVIEDAAFYNCKSLNRVILEQNIVLNGISIFQKCSALSDCYMQNSNVSDIPEYSFNQCSNLNTINFSNNTRTIQRYAFADCSYINHITFPKNLNLLSDYVFYNCNNLIDVQFYSQVSNISKIAFEACKNMQHIEVNGSGKYSSVNGVLFSENGTNLFLFPAGREGQYFDMPNNVKTISRYAFKYSRIHEVVISSNVQYIENNTFENCSNLRILYFLGNPTIEDNAFVETKKDIIISCNQGTGAESFAKKNKKKYILRETDMRVERVLWAYSDNLNNWYSAKEVSPDYYDLTNEQQAFSIQPVNGQNIVVQVITNMSIRNTNLQLGESPYYSTINPNAWIELSGDSNNIYHIENYRPEVGYDSNYGREHKEFMIAVDRSDLVREIWYSDKNPTNQNVEIEIITNRAISSFGGTGWEKVSNRLYRKIYEQNGSESFTISDGIGNSVPVSISVTNIDKTSPSVVGNIRYSITGLTNKDVVVTIEANEALQDIGNGWNLSANKRILSKTYSSNYSEDVQLIDLVGNITTVKVNVGNIDKNIPTASATYNPTLTAPTNQNVLVTVKTNKEVRIIESDGNWSIDNARKTLTKTYVQNREEAIQLEDDYGNRVTVRINVTNIDKNPPSATVSYSKEIPTNQPVVATITAKERLQPLNGWTLSSDALSLSKTYSENKTEKITIKDIPGNETVVNIKINNIDKDAPIGTPSYSTKDPTNEPVTVTITSNEVINEVDGWVLDNTRKILTKTYNDNASETVKIVDLAGNVTDVSVNVDNIDKGNPSAEIFYETKEPTNKDVKVTIKASEQIRPVEGWELDSGKTILTKIFELNGQETVIITDVAGNTYEVLINVENIDKEPPKLTVEYSRNSFLVIAKVKSNKPIKKVEASGWSFDEEAYTLVKQYTFNTSETLRIEDLVGNVSKIDITVSSIQNFNPGGDSEIEQPPRDTTPPKASIDYSIKDLTNQDVIVKITADEEIQEVKGWTLSANKKEILKTYTKNESETVVLKDKSGNESKVQVVVNNIDKVLPKVDYVVEDTESTAKRVVIISDKEIRQTDGWTLNEDKKSLTKIYTENKEETVEVLDLAGNKVLLQVKVGSIQNNDDNTEIKTTVYNINGKYITNIPVNTKKSEFVKNISGDYKVLDNEENEISDDTIIGTGYILRTNNGIDYKLVVSGDTNGDGKATVTDLAKVRKHIVNISLLENEYYMAADLNNDEKITITDLVKIKKIIAGIN